MSVMIRAVRALAGLFFDDGRLALEMLFLLACTAAVAGGAAERSWAAISVLVGGTLLLLVRNVLRAARSR